MELTVATAIMTTVFAAVMPLFAGIRRSAEGRWASLEMVQNARVLNEHLGRWLAQARRITAISAAADAAGYVDFEAADGLVYRCAAGPHGAIEFGPLGRLRPLVGPVASLRFAGFDAADCDRPAPTPERIRLVTWEAALRSPGHFVKDKVVPGACCLRADCR